MKQIADNGLSADEEYLVVNAIEKIKREYNNKNVESHQRTMNNRLLLLCEDHYHGDLLANIIDKNHELIKG